MVCLFVAVHKFPFDPLRLAGNHVFHGAGLVVFLFIIENFFKQNKQFARAVARVFALKVRLPQSGRIVAVHRLDNLLKQQRLARTVHIAVHHHRRGHLGARMLQRISQPAVKVLHHQRIAVAQMRNQLLYRRAARKGSQHIQPARALRQSRQQLGQLFFQRQAAVDIDVVIRHLHTRLKHHMVKALDLARRAVHPHLKRAAHRQLGCTLVDHPPQSVVPNRA